jgi:hypothetical protein
MPFLYHGKELSSTVEPASLDELIFTKVFPDVKWEVEGRQQSAWILPNGTPWLYRSQHTHQREAFVALVAKEHGISLQDFGAWIDYAVSTFAFRDRGLLITAEKIQLPRLDARKPLYKWQGVYRSGLNVQAESSERI